MARVCRTVLVEPPMAMSRAKALSKASRVTISRGRDVRCDQVEDAARRPGGPGLRVRGSRARADAVVGQRQPERFHRQFMLLAVNMPEQEPQDGQAKSSSIFRRAASILPAWKAPTPSKTEIRSIASPSGVRPAAIGPPETKIVGMLTRIAAINMPGTILSQLGMQTMPSKQWARSMVSTQSAISSREGSEYFMPDVAHGDAVVHADGVELERHAARLAHGLLDQLAEFLQVGVAGDDIDVGVDDGDEGLAHVGIGDADRFEQGAVGSARITVFNLMRTHFSSKCMDR